MFRSKWIACFSLCGLLILSACGSNKGEEASLNRAATVTDPEANICGDSKLIGSWTRDAIGGLETVQLGSNCKGSSNYCEYAISFAATRDSSTPTGGSTGKINLSITGSNAADGCLLDGNHNACNYSVTNLGLTINCEAGSISFDKGN